MAKVPRGHRLPSLCFVVLALSVGCDRAADNGEWQFEKFSDGETRISLRAASLKGIVALATINVHCKRSFIPYGKTNYPSGTYIASLYIRPKLAPAGSGPQDDIAPVSDLLDSRIEYRDGRVEEWESYPLEFDTWQYNRTKTGRQLLKTHIYAPPSDTIKLVKALREARQISISQEVHEWKFNPHGFDEALKRLKCTAPVP